MKPVIESHIDYRGSLSRRMERHGINWKSYPASVRETFLRFRELDLSAVDRIMMDKYSVLGAKPRQPSAMLRSLLLMIKTKSPSITLWVATLHTSPFFAVLSGFEPDDVPGVGSFYDFMRRLWNRDKSNFSEHVKPPVARKVQKPKGKGQKAESIERETVAQLIIRLSSTAFHVDKEAYGTLLQIFRSCFLDESIRLGMIHPESLNVAGDGTPVETAARFRSHHTCDCWKKNIFDCDCPRFFPQPDCDIGWDSSRERWYFGYDLYLLTDADSGLPLFPVLNPASKHDSHGFCEAFFRFRALLPGLKPASLLLDSAHDSMAMYSLCQREYITPFIDLNLGNSKKTSDYHGVTLGPDGVPICSAGLKMKTNGNDLRRLYAKFRCPLNNNGKCSCDNPCSDAKFGRTCSIPMADNIRLYTSPPRDSDKWKAMYNKRTSAERSNKQIKLDSLLELGKHRSTMLWYVRLYLVMMLLHLSHRAVPV